MGDSSMYQVDITAAVIFVLTTLGSFALYWYRKRIRKWRLFWRSIIDGVRSLPELQALVADGGSGTLRDSIHRTEAAINSLTEQVDIIVQTMWAENDADDNVGRFHCNGNGQVTYVNQLYARWLGVGKIELMGWKYLNFIHPDDVDRFRHYWELCRSEHRQCRTNYRLVSVDGSTIYVDLIATPIPENAPAHRWVCSFRRTDREKAAA